ncbi:MAG: transcriptional repressor, partial [Paludibacteraceae bacterium]|nr:transcriptional repressor [Paludibacteraceae bacterium]
MESSESTKKTIKKIFTEYLDKHAMRKTPERFAILDKIYSIKGHFDVETIYNMLLEDNYHVSKATIYNNIGLLLDCKLVTRHQFGGSTTQYEKSYNTGIHNHIICTKCGMVREFTDTNIKRAIQNKHIKDFTIESYTL